jgi:pyrroline-5-carboxylate reductase
MKEHKLGIIGAGNMATAILQGILNHNIINRNEIIISDIDLNKLNILYSNGVDTTTTNEELINSSEYILFAVKPQSFKKLDKNIFAYADNKAVISIMAGITTKEIGDMVGHNRICRIMPNLPLMYNQGMSALCFKDLEEEDKILIKNIFDSIGTTIVLDEDKLDAVTSISGSGPAYVFYFINSMIKAGMKNGLSYDQAKLLTTKTFIGASKMLEKSNDDISVLINNVCSKGGTTIEAVNCFRENNVEDIIINAIDKCYNRSCELSKYEKG